jgi:hypothetical protein
MSQFASVELEIPQSAAIQIDSYAIGLRHERRLLGCCTPFHQQSAH